MPLDQGAIKRLRLKQAFASYFEITFCIFVYCVVFLGRAGDSSYQSQRDLQTFINVATSPLMIFIVLVIFIEVFNAILTSRSVLVDVAASAVKISRTDPPVTPDSMTTKVSDPVPVASAKSDVAIEQLFRDYILRSQTAANVAQRRPNVLLFVGTFIAIVGLLFFVATLPQAGDIMVVAGMSDMKNASLNAYEKLFSVVPRFLMLIFIQLLAGFFLRQYRSSMEEFRYYEAVLRRREAQFVSFVLRRDIDDKKALSKFAELILEEKALDVLTEKQTTAVMQAHREEKNEFIPAIDRILAFKSVFGGSKRFRPPRVTKSDKA